MQADTSAPQQPLKTSCLGQSSAIIHVPLWWSSRSLGVICHAAAARYPFLNHTAAAAESLGKAEVSSAQIYWLTRANAPLEASDQIVARQTSRKWGILRRLLHGSDRPADAAPQVKVSPGNYAVGCLLLRQLCSIAHDANLTFLTIPVTRSSKRGDDPQDTKSARAAAASGRGYSCRDPAFWTLTGRRRRGHGAS